MRQGSNPKRLRGRTGRKNTHPRSQTFESNGPEVKVRGKRPASGREISRACPGRIVGGRSDHGGELFPARRTLLPGDDGEWRRRRPQRPGSSPEPAARTEGRRQRRRAAATDRGRLERQRDPSRTAVAERAVGKSPPGKPGPGSRRPRNRACLPNRTGAYPSIGADKDWLTSGRSTTPLPSCPDLFRPIGAQPAPKI